MMKVSILVAVYNGERYIRRCLSSLVRQTYKNIEIVCIDDGSTDGSVHIISEFATADSRIKLLRHDTNKGLAEAMNTGLGACTGDVIGYLDCDDWYDDDTVERLVRVFDQNDDADSVLYRCIYVDSTGAMKDYQGMPFDALNGKDAFMASLTWRIHGVYAARAELFRRFPYDTTRRHFSNDNTTRLHYYNSRKVYQSDAPYYYMYNPQSISNQVSVARMDYLAATKSMKRQLEALGCEESTMRLYEDERMKVLVDCYMFYYKNRNSFTMTERNHCFEEMKSALRDIESARLSTSLRRKFGYCPFGGNWTLFRMQEELYFLLKKITGRL